MSDMDLKKQLVDVFKQIQINQEAINHCNKVIDQKDHMYAMILQAMNPNGPDVVSDCTEQLKVLHANVKTIIEPIPSLIKELNLTADSLTDIFNSCVRDDYSCIIGKLEGLLGLTNNQVDVDNPA